MLFEDSFSAGPDTPIALSMPEDPIERPYEGSTEYTETGFVVVGAEYTSSGQMMLVSDAQGRALGVAFDDGDGNWDNEWEALTDGLLCGILAGTTAVSEGALVPWTGAATAVTCADFLYSLNTSLQRV